VALEILQALDSVRQSRDKGLTMSALSARLALTAQQLEPAVERLVAMDWIGLLSEAQGPGAEPEHGPVQQELFG
jgi:hypothetical protein